MANGSYTPRNKGMGDWDKKWDTFDDVPDYGLSESEAGRDAFRIQQQVVDDGLAVNYVDNDNGRRSYVVTWPELIALSMGQNPSDPRINAGHGWVMVRDEGRVFPSYVPPGAPKNPVYVEIEVHEARNAVERGKRVWGRDQLSIAVLRACQAIVGQQQQGRR